LLICEIAVMKIIKIAYQQVYDCDSPGHLEIGEIMDYHKGLIIGYRRLEIEKQLDECRRCKDNFLTVKHNLTIKDDYS